MRPSLEAVLQQAMDPSGRILGLLDDSKISEFLTLPPQVLEVAVAMPAARKRLARNLAERFGFRADGPDRSLALLPSSPHSLQRALGRFSLAVALASHPAIFRRDEYGVLAEVWGDATLQFAIRHRPRTAERHLAPPLPLDRTATTEAGRPLLVNSLAETHPAVAAVLALVYDVEPSLPDASGRLRDLGQVAVSALEQTDVPTAPTSNPDEFTGTT